ncbi:MAG: thioredoxin domain-containing protein [Alphaproteobacteria bacterium]
MADDTPEQKTPESSAPAKKSSDKKLFLGLGVLFLLLAVAYGVSLGPVETEAPELDSAQVEEVEQAFNDEESPAVETVETVFDLEAAKKERILGDSSAPIKISEHSSFSCGHCGKFHNEVFADFKKAYIDTGKAYLVFSDFPLNAPALHATMAARCVSEDRYFDFAADLFATQKDWAYEQNYLSLLEEKAGRYGLDKATFSACVSSEALQKAILERIQGVQAQWEVRSTPSFVVNNQEVISGALSFDKFDAAIQEALTAIESAGGADGEIPDEDE